MQKNQPVVIHVPHASVCIPPEEQPFFVTHDLSREIAVMTDHYCDDLYDTGDTMIRFPISRLVCDPERFREDADEGMARIGMGAVYTSCSDGSELKHISRLHREEILSRYYDPHHQRLERAVEEKLRHFGTCLLIDGHSFHDVPLPYESDQNTPRPDICIGTDAYHTPDDLTECLFQFFQCRGYSVAVDRPFAGSLVPMKYYRRDSRVRSVMIELNRGLYMDHGLNRTSGYQKIKEDIAAAISHIS